MNDFGKLQPRAYPFGATSRDGSFGKDDDSGKEICWQKTKFKGKYKVDPVKPVVKFSIVFEMWCECGPEDDPNSDDYTLGQDNFHMDRGTKPPCSEFSGKFKERSHECESQTFISPFYGDDYTDCCEETKCATVVKEISFEDLMPIPFELLTPRGHLSQGLTCQHGPNAPMAEDWVGQTGSEGPGWENTGDDKGNASYYLWGTSPGDPPPGAAGNPGAGVPLTPRAQSMRILGCTIGNYGNELMGVLQDIVADSGQREGTIGSGRGLARAPGENNVKEEDDPGPGPWNYARVKTPEERDAVLRETLVCRGLGGKSSLMRNAEQQVADQALELCFTLGGAFDTDYNDSDPGGFGKPDSVGDDDLNAGLRDKGENEGEEPGGWFNEMRPKLDCYNCECENPMDDLFTNYAGTWGSPFDCTNPPCEDPPDIH